MKRVCPLSGQEFEIKDSDLEFYKRFDVPPPRLSPDERMRRRLAWRNERTLYRRQCDLCHQNIIAMYPVDTPFPVYCPGCWFSDRWDAQQFGRDFDFSRAFFPQFLALQNDVPRLSLINARNENSEFCNLVGDSRNCYLIFSSIGCEDCLYDAPFFSKSCVDCLLVYHSELCYECLDSERLYHCTHCQNCSHSHDLSFCFDVQGSHDCSLCAGLRRAKYCILNEQYSPEDYKQKKAAWEEKSFAERWQAFCDIKKSVPHKYFFGVGVENVTGDYIVHSKNCERCFHIDQGEDLKHCTQASKSKLCMDCDVGEFSEFLYEVSGFHRLQDVRLSHWCWDGCSQITYCSSCRSTRNSFGSTCLDHHRYCLLNKPYPKDEYFALRDKVIAHMTETGEWGEFFPIEISPFAYNETVAQEYFPLSEAEVSARGWKWRTPEKKISLSTSEDILTCTDCAKPYKLQSAEKRFYAQMELPTPEKCPQCRHAERLYLRNPRRLFFRQCARCEVEFQTTFSPDRPEEILCEKCYHEHVHGGGS